MEKSIAEVEAEIAEMIDKCVRAAQRDREEGVDTRIRVMPDGSLMMDEHTPNDGYIEGIDDRIIFSASAIGSHARDVYDPPGGRWDDGHPTQAELDEWAEDMDIPDLDDFVKEAMAGYNAIMMKDNKKEKA